MTTRQKLRTNTAYPSARTIVSVLALIQLAGFAVVGMSTLDAFGSQKMEVALSHAISAAGFLISGILIFTVGQAFFDIADAGLANHETLEGMKRSGSEQSLETMMQPTGMPADVHSKTAMYSRPKK